MVGKKEEEEEEIKAKLDDIRSDRDRILEITQKIRNRNDRLLKDLLKTDDLEHIKKINREMLDNDLLRSGLQLLDQQCIAYSNVLYHNLNLEQANNKYI